MSAVPYDEAMEAIAESRNVPIADMLMKCRSVFASHSHALVSVSGGGRF